MRVLIVQNYDKTGLGLVGAALEEAGAEIDLRRPFEGEALPADAAGHDAMVVLGGGQNALADEEHPYFPALLDLTRDFAARDRAVLGARSVAFADLEAGGVYVGNPARKIRERG